MPSIAESIDRIVAAATWNQRVAQIRLIPQHHGTGDHPTIYAGIARALYVHHLAPDFAYIHDAPFYGEDYFRSVYRVAAEQTELFQRVSEADLARVIREHPQTLLVFRTLLGLTKEEFAHSTLLAAATTTLAPLSSNKIDSMERSGTRTTVDQASLAAKSIVEIMGNSLFGTPPPTLRSKQDKPDTANGWDSVRRFAVEGVPLGTLLHQRHYGGAFRQVLDATSTLRGDLIEDAVEQLFLDHRVPFLRTGSHNQEDIANRFEVRVTPAPDFVVFGADDGLLKGLLECKGTNNGGTARDKALRFERLREESVRLGGVPLFAVLGGIGWARVNDALGPVIRDTDGRVFTLSTLSAMLEVAPFPPLIGTQPVP